MAINLLDAGAKGMGILLENRESVSYQDTFNNISH
jgi:hypothetical protein